MTESCTQFSKHGILGGIMLDCDFVYPGDFKKYDT